MALTMLMSAGLLTLPFATSAFAQNVSFEGEQITMMIGYNPGGGTDTTGRLLAEYLVKELPGQPDVVFRNMPAGSGTTAMNYFARQVEPDGRTFTVGSSTQASPARWQASASRYDPTEFHYIGGAERGSKVLIINKDAVDRLTDHSQPPVVMGALDGTRSGMQMMMWGMEYLDWNAEWVIGYPGTGDLMLALQRGEIDVTSTANGREIDELLATGDFELLVQSGTPSANGFIPRAEFPEIPILPELVRPLLETDLENTAFDYWEGINTLDKYWALPPGTPENIVDVYRSAFEKASANEEFLRRGVNTISEDFSIIDWAAQGSLIRQVALVPEDALEFIDSLREKQRLPVSSR